MVLTDSRVRKDRRKKCSQGEMNGDRALSVFRLLPVQDSEAAHFSGPVENEEEGENLKGMIL